MSIFTKGKPVQIAPIVTETLQEMWISAIDDADSIAVIGVNPNPEDDHIWGPLAATESPVHMIGNEKSIQDWFKLERNGRPSNFLGPRFHDCIADIAISL